jgi:hypothetical protein
VVDLVHEIAIDGSGLHEFFVAFLKAKTEVSDRLLQRNDLTCERIDVNARSEAFFCLGC